MASSDAHVVLEFLDEAGDPQRLAAFAQMAEAGGGGATAASVRELYDELLGLIRRALNQRRCYVEVATAGLAPGCYRVTRVRRHDGIEAVPDRSPWRVEGVPVRQGGAIACVLARGRVRRQRLIWRARGCGRHVRYRGRIACHDHPCRPGLRRRLFAT